MTALAADKQDMRVRAGGDLRRIPCFYAAANAVIHLGSLIAKGGVGNAFATVATAAGGQVIGHNAGQEVINTGGADGAIAVPDIECGRVRLKNGTAACTNADIGRIVYVQDDQTVGRTGVVPAGILMELEEDSAGVYVYVHVDPITTAALTAQAQVNNQADPAPLLFFTFLVPDAATGDIDIVMTRKVEVIDATAQKQNGAGAANTMQVKKGATAITDAIACAVDNALTRAASIDDAQSTLNIGDTLRLTATRAAGTRNALVTVFAIPRA